MDDLISRRDVLDLLTAIYGDWQTDETRAVIELITTEVEKMSCDFEKPFVCEDCPVFDWSVNGCCITRRYLPPSVRQVESPDDCPIRIKVCEEPIDTTTYGDEKLDRKCIDGLCGGKR